MSILTGGCDCRIAHRSKKSSSRISTLLLSLPCGGEVRRLPPVGQGLISVEQRRELHPREFLDFKAGNQTPVTLTAASKPKMYEKTPKPEICPLQTDAIKDLCRNFSRAWMFDRWISMTGNPTAEMASRRAMLVWV